LQRLVYSNLKLGNDQEALRYMKAIFSMDPIKEHTEILDRIFLESGMEGVLHWYVDWLQNNESPDFYYVAQLNLKIAGIYGLLGDVQHAMEYLEKAWETGDISLPYIKFNPNLALLRDDPRFKAMLKEMNLD
jgi:hypothetical protein